MKWKVAKQFKASNNKLTSLKGLENLISVGGLLDISVNQELSSLKGLNPKIRIDGDVYCYGTNDNTDFELSDLTKLFNKNKGIFYRNILLSCSYEISTTDEYGINERAAELDPPKELTDEDWDTLNKDSNILERNIYWYFKDRKDVIYMNNEGHGGYNGELVGTIEFYKYSRIYYQLWSDHCVGTWETDADVYDGVSELGQSLLDGQLYCDPTQAENHDIDEE